MAKSLRAMHWREHLHPRDNRGRFAEKGGSKWLTKVADQVGAAFGDASMGPRLGEAPRGRLQTGKGGLIDVAGMSKAAPRTAPKRGTFELGSKSRTSSEYGGKVPVGRKLGGGAAGGVPVSSLKKGDHARVQGEDIYGRKITMNGYVDNPTPVKVGGRGSKRRRDMVSVTVSEQPNGGGTHSRVLVEPGATVERTEPSVEMKRLEGRAPGGRRVESGTIDRSPVKAQTGGVTDTTPPAAKPITQLVRDLADKLEKEFPNTAKPTQSWSGERPAITKVLRSNADQFEAGTISKAELQTRLARISIESGVMSNGYGRHVSATLKEVKKTSSRTPKQDAALAAGRARAKELRAEDLRDSIDPKQNGAKIAAIEAGTLDYADLYRTKVGGASGQRSQSPVARVRYTPDNPSGEFRISDPSSGTLLGWASRTVHDGQQTYVFHSEDYDGGQKLEGWSDSLATGADVLRIGEHAATRGGSNYHAAISQGGFKRYAPLTPEEADRAEAARELKNARERLASGKLGPELTARYQAIVDKAEGRQPVPGAGDRDLRSPAEVAAVSTFAIRSVEDPNMGTVYKIEQTMPNGEKVLRGKRFSNRSAANRDIASLKDEYRREAAARGENPDQGETAGRIQVARMAGSGSSGDDFAAEARAAVAKVDPRKDWNLSKEAPAGAKIPLTSGGKPKAPRSGSTESTPESSDDFLSRMSAKVSKAQSTPGAKTTSAAATSIPSVHRIAKDAGVERPHDRDAQAALDTANRRFAGGEDATSVAAYLREQARVFDTAREEVPEDDDQRYSELTQSANALRQTAEALEKSAPKRAGRRPGGATAAEIAERDEASRAIERATAGGGSTGGLTGRPGDIASRINAFQLTPDETRLQLNTLSDAEVRDVARAVGIEPSSIARGNMLVAEIVRKVIKGPRSKALARLDRQLADAKAALSRAEEKRRNKGGSRIASLAESRLRGKVSTIQQEILRVEREERESAAGKA